MAEKLDDQIKKQKELNELKKEQIALDAKLKKSQSDSYDLSSSLVDSLKESLGIRSRISTFDSNLLGTNKQINKAILEQKIGLSSVEELNKQITKNQDLINKGKLFENGLYKLQNINEKINLNDIKSKIKNQKSLEEQLKEQIELVENGEKIERKTIENLEKQIKENEKLIEQKISELNPLQQQYLINKLNTEELIRQNEERKKEKEYQEKINKTLGLSGALLKGINQIPFLKDIPGISGVLDKVKEKIDKNTTSAEAFGFTLEEVGKVIKEAMLDPLALIGIFGKFLIDIMAGIDTQVGNLAKNFGISYGNAVILNEKMSLVAITTNDVNVTSKNLLESIQAIGNSLGSNAVASNENLIAFTKLTKEAGFTKEEIIGIEQLTLSTNTNLESNVKSIIAGTNEINRSNKVMLNQKEIAKDVNNLSKATLLSLNQNPEAIGKAVAQAKALGLTMEQLDKISDSLLNFESSISSEMEAELLTGKQLNLEQARYYALTNQTEELSKELAKNFGTTAEFSKMNRIQQEAAAKAVGMSREELASTLFKQQALSNLSAKDADTAERYLQARAKVIGIDAAIAEANSEGYENLLKSQNLQEKFNATVEKLKEIFVAALSPIIWAADKLSLIPGLLEGISVAIGTVIVGFAAMAAYALATAIAATLGTATLPILGSLAIAGGVLGAIVGGIKAASSIKDGLISPDGGLVVSGEKGTYKLDKNDHVIAGTDLGKTSNTLTSNDNSQLLSDKIGRTSNTLTSSDSAQIVAELKSLKEVMNQILNKEGNVYIDGNKVGHSLVLANSKLG